MGAGEAGGGRRGVRRRAGRKRGTQTRSGRNDWEATRFRIGSAGLCMSARERTEPDVPLGPRTFSAPTVAQTQLVPWLTPFHG